MPTSSNSAHSMASGHTAATARDVLVARQPIFSRDGRVAAYQLEYLRDAEASGAEASADNDAAAHALINSMLDTGLDGLTDGRRATVMVSREMLADGTCHLLDPLEVLLEIRLPVDADGEVVDACRRLTMDGYELIFGEFVLAEARAPLLALASVVKVAVADRTAVELASIRQRLRQPQVRLLAADVATMATHSACCSAGFELFHGRFYSQPVVVETRELTPGVHAILQLMQKLRDPDASDAELRDALSDPVMSYKLLRMVNSAALGGRGVESIEHAVRLMGRGALHRWLSLLLVAAGHGVGTFDELARSAMQRARFCELLASHGGRRLDGGSLFLVGLFSRLDALLRLPIGDILQRVSLAPEVQSALLSHDGPYAPALALIEAYDEARWPEVARAAPALGIAIAQLPGLYAESLAWARSMLAASAGDDAVSARADVRSRN